MTWEAGRRQERIEEEMRKRELVEIELAKRADLSSEEYISLAKSFFSVKVVLARNHNIPEEIRETIIEILAEDPNPMVQAAIIENKNIPRKFLKRFTYSSNEIVRKKALELIEQQIQERIKRRI